MSKFMNHNDYSNWVILKAAEKAKDGKYKSLTHAFKIAAKTLKCRPSQVSSKYYDLRQREVTLESVRNWTEQDRVNFDAGAPEKIIRSYPKGQGTKLHTGERFTPAKGEEPEVKVVLTKNEDGSENVHLHNIREAVKSLVKDTPPAFRIAVIKSIMNDM